MWGEASEPHGKGPRGGPGDTLRASSRASFSATRSIMAPSTASPTPTRDGGGGDDHEARPPPPAGAVELDRSARRASLFGNCICGRWQETAKRGRTQTKKGPANVSGCQRGCPQGVPRAARGQQDQRHSLKVKCKNTCRSW